LLAGQGADSSKNTARPTTTQLIPFRAAAAISSSSRKDAATAVQPHGGYGIAKRERKEVPLASQEPTKGLVQYALYVSLLLSDDDDDGDDDFLHLHLC
jgi:hypothetical protein